MKRTQTIVTEEFDKDGKIIRKSTETIEEDDNGEMKINPLYPIYPYFPSYSEPMKIWHGTDTPLYNPNITAPWVPQYPYITCGTSSINQKPTNIQANM